MASPEYTSDENSGKPAPFERTAESDHFFLPSGRIVYQGSALIVSLLELHLAVEDRLQHKQSFAFFDKDGAFYNSLTLKELRPDIHVNGTTVQKHTAIFETTGAGDDRMLDMPIDAIRCLSLIEYEDPAPSLMGRLLSVMHKVAQEQSEAI